LIFHCKPQANKFLSQKNAQNPRRQLPELCLRPAFPALHNRFDGIIIGGGDKLFGPFSSATMVEPKTRYYRDMEVKMSDAQIVIANHDQEKIKEIVVFEDGEIKVLFWKGCSEKIIVTFGDLISGGWNKVFCRYPA
jgi:hypothetical protein